MAYPYFWLLQIGDDEEEEGGEEGEEGEAEEKMPTCGDYIMHFLTLFWKILFAFIPPAGEYFIRIILRFDATSLNANSLKIIILTI